MKKMLTHALACVYLVSAYWMTWDNWFAMAICAFMVGWSMGKWLSMYIRRRTMIPAVAAHYISIKTIPFVIDWKLALAMDLFVLVCLMYSGLWFTVAFLVVSIFCEQVFRYQTIMFMDEMLDALMGGKEAE